MCLYTDTEVTKEQNIRLTTPIKEPLRSLSVWQGYRSIYRSVL